MEYENIVRDVLCKVTGNAVFLNAKNKDKLIKYGLDSIVFVEFIIEFENVLNVKLPSNILLLKNGESIEKICKNLRKYLTKKYKEI